MSKKIVHILIFLISTFCFSQESLNDLLNRFNNKSIPYMSVEELAMPKIQAVILDAREIEEYTVSHITDAIHVGFDEFDLSQTTKHLNDKKQLIVVYCSLGVRSEDIGEKLKKAGYANIYNLYGGIFEWKNKNFTVYNSEEKVTDSIHTFSKEWSKWLEKGKKVYPEKAARNE